jgi:ABC-type phosphate transport system permease subunit
MVFCSSYPHFRRLFLLVLFVLILVLLFRAESAFNFIGLQAICRTNWEAMQDKLGGYAGQIGRLCRTNWEADFYMQDKLGG